MDSNEVISIEMEHLEPSHTIHVDLANLEITQRKLYAELKMKRVQVEQLRKQEDEQNMKIHELKGNLDTNKAKLLELEFELDITKNTCAAYNVQLKNTSTQSKVQLEKLQLENQSLKELLQKSEMEHRILLRKFEDLTSLHELEAANRKDFIEHESQAKAATEKILHSFKAIEKESVQIKIIQEKLQQIKESQHYIDVYKQLAKDAIAKRDEMEEQYLTVKVKLDVLTDLLEKYPLPQATPACSTEYYKEQIVQLQKELDEERKLTISQNKRLTAEITQNVALCLRIDSLERNMNRSSKCMKDICLQTDN